MVMLNFVILTATLDFKTLAYSSIAGRICLSLKHPELLINIVT